MPILDLPLLKDKKPLGDGKVADIPLLVNPVVTTTIDDLDIGEKMSEIQTFVEAKPEPSFLEKVIDVVARTEYASANVFDAVKKGESFLDVGKAAWKGFSGEDKRRYENLLDEYGMEKGWKRTVLGFVSGTLLDPITYIPFGIFAKGGKVATSGLKNLVKVGKVSATTQKSHKILQETAELIAKRTPAELQKQGLKDATQLSKTLPAKVKGEWSWLRQNFEKAVPQARKIRPERRVELKTLVEKEVKITKDLGLNKIETEFVKNYRKSMDKLYKLEHPKGLIKTTYTHPYVEHILTREARESLTEYNLKKMPQAQRSLLKGLVKQLQPKPIPGRTYVAGKKFLGIKLEEGTIQELNDIAIRRIPALKGKPFFEEDLAKIWMHRVGLSTQNQLLHDSLKDFGMKWWKGGLFHTYAPKKQYGKWIEQYYLRPQTIQAQMLKTMKAGARPRGALLPEYKSFKILPLRGMQGPIDVVDTVEKTYKTLGNIEELNKFMRAFDGFTRFFKASVTIPWPSFHMLNAMGGQFNNFLHLGEIKLAQRLFDTAKVLAKRGTFKIKSTGKVVKGSDIYEQYIKAGAGGGWFRGELGMKGLEPLRSKMVDTLKIPIRLPGVAAAKVEDINRLPLFIDEFLKHGDATKAANLVFKYQFNYAPEALRAGEQQVLRRIIPFYVWIRNNVPLQIESLYKQTGKFARFFRGVSTAGPSWDERELLPEWQRDEILMNVPEYFAQKFRENPEQKIFVSVNVPVADALSQMDYKRFFSAINPLVRVPLEMIFNKQLFFGNQIWNPDLPTEQQTSKAYPILKELPAPLQDFINFKEFQKFNSVTGQWEIRYEADAKKLYILRTALAGISRFYWETGKSLEEKEFFASLWDFMSPVRIRKVDMKEQEYWQYRDKKSKLQAIENYFRGKRPVSEETSREYLTEPILPPSRVEGKVLDLPLLK